MATNNWEYQPKEEKGYYKPKTKKHRLARKKIWDRFQVMRDDPIRQEVEKEWDMADKMCRMWTPERDPDDWRADIVLPDGLAAVMSHLQETIDLRPRPVLEAVEPSAEPLEMFNNTIFNYSMDKTDFDLETFMARKCATIRGTAFTIERYRLEKRTVQDPTKVNEEGEIEYTEKEITDMDDTYTQFVDNARIYLDPSAAHQKYLRDFIEEEILDVEEFNLRYGNKPGFMNQKWVQGAGQVSSQAQFFKRATDFSDDEVQLLHYWNRSTDTYDVLANNVLIRQGPIPFKHKELPLAVWYHYPIEGRIYGIGIPKIIFSVAEERRSIRNISLDRMKLHLSKMFIVNDLFDLDDEDLTPRPHGLIKVSAGSIPLSNAIQPLEYGDVPGSSIRMDDTLLEDERRAHGIDDRIQGVNMGGTATEAAILKESSQRRINLVNTLADMDTLTRIGRLKWSNIQFFYPSPKVEKITEGDKTKNKKTHRKVRVEGKEFEVVKEGDRNSLKMRSVEGATSFTLNSKMARFMEGEYDVVIKPGQHAVVSKPIKQAKTTEMFNLLMNNPQLAQHVEGKKSVKRLLVINDEDPKHWMRGAGLTDEEMRQLAMDENEIMKEGTELAPTLDITDAHTEEHINYALTSEFEALPDETKLIFEKHIMGELSDSPEGMPAEEAPTDPMEEMIPDGMTPDMMGGGPGPEIQPMDMQPSTVSE